MKRERKSRVPLFLSTCFFAGVLGALANSLLVWGMGASGLNGLLGIAVDPALSWSWLRPRLVWGGLWGILFIPVIFRTAADPVQWGLLLSLLPSINQLVYVFPVMAGQGMAGLNLGPLTPGLVLVANAVWGLVAAFWIAWGIDR